MPKQSAGLILFRGTGERTEVLLVHPGGPFYVRKDDGVWSIPKGEYEPGQDPVEVALAEFEEELGTPAPVSPADLVELGSVRQKGGKVVLAWCASADLDVIEIRSNTFELEWPPRSGRVQEFPEIDRAEWFALPAARLKLIEAQVELIDRLEAMLGGA